MWGALCSTSRDAQEQGLLKIRTKKQDLSIDTLCVGLSVSPRKMCGFSRSFSLTAAWGGEALLAELAALHTGRRAND